jgi:hypothetical protein
MKLTHYALIRTITGLKVEATVSVCRGADCWITSCGTKYDAITGEDENGFATLDIDTLTPCQDTKSRRRN